MPILGMFGGARRLSGQRKLTPEEEAAQQARPRRSMGEMASGLPSASPLFGGQMMRELPQQKQQQPPPPQAKPPSMWDDISQDPLAFLLSGTNGIAKRQKQQRFDSAIDGLNLSPADRARAEIDPEGYFRSLNEINTSAMKPQTGTFYDPKTSQWNIKPQGPVKLGPGDVLGNVGEDNSWEQIFAAPASETNAGVQSTFVDDRGQLNLVMRDGKVVNKGIQARGGIGTVDVGGVPYTYDRYGQNGVKPIATPEDVGGNKATVNDITARGEDKTKAALDLPTQIANAEASLAVIDDFLAHPESKNRYGWRGVFPAFPGKEAGAQGFIDQIGGSAFLEAYEGLKGGGQIANAEGAKATQAKTRLTNQHQDWPSAQKAAQELRKSIADRILRAKVRAGQLNMSELTEEQLRVLAAK